MITAETIYSGCIGRQGSFFIYILCHLPTIFDVKLIYVKTFNFGSGFGILVLCRLYLLFISPSLPTLVSFWKCPEKNGLIPMHANACKLEGRG